VEGASTDSTQPWEPSRREPEGHDTTEPTSDATPGDPAPAEIEGWPSREAPDAAAGADAAEQRPWPTEPPAAGSAGSDAWPTQPPERGEDPVFASDTDADRTVGAPAPTPDSGGASDASPETLPVTPPEVEAYPGAPIGDPASSQTSDPITAAHAVPAGESSTGESTQCPRCGTENRPGLAFCRNCGQRLVVAGVASTVERPGTPDGSTACPRCGTHNRAGVAFCQNCGANLRGTGPDYVPPAVAAEPDTDLVIVERRGAILGPVVLLIGLIGLVTGYLLPFVYGSLDSLLERAVGEGGYGVAFWSGYPDVTGSLADQAYFGLAAPLPLLVLLIAALAVGGFARAVPGRLQVIGLVVTLLWSVALIVLFLIVELAGNWDSDLVGMLRVLTPAGIIFFLASLIVVIGALTRFGRS